MPIRNIEERRKYHREWKAKRRRAWLLENGPCKKCGSLEDLEVDHISPSDKISHNVWSWSWERRLAELAKCQVLCRQCHLEKTVLYRKENAKSQVHGTHEAYVLGCRCQECRSAHASSVRNWRYKTGRRSPRVRGIVAK